MGLEERESGEKRTKSLLDHYPEPQEKMGKTGVSWTSNKEEDRYQDINQERRTDRLRYDDMVENEDKRKDES
jgi:hypothetical protein